MTDSHNLLTIPQSLVDYQLYLPSGSGYVSLPTVRPDGCIENLNVLSMEARGLLEFAGAPLFALPGRRGFVVALEAMKDQ